jgi:hypothetical protein
MRKLFQGRTPQRYAFGQKSRVLVVDPSQVTKLFAERLQAWKHAVAYLEDYVSATEKTNHAHGKEYERVLKV